VNLCRWAVCNGELVPLEAATLGIENHGLTFGSVAFESLRVFSTPAGLHALALTPHIDRLRASAAAIGLGVPPADEIQRLFWAVVRQNDLEDGYVRFLAFPGGSGLKLEVKGQPCSLNMLVWRLEGARLVAPATLAVAQTRRPDAGSTAPRAKLSGKYFQDVIAQGAARGDGYEEALLLHQDGTVSEMSGANIAIVKNGELVTPHIPHTIDGLTRRLTFDLARELAIPMTERVLPLEDVLAADEVLALGTYHGLRSVSAIGRRQMPEPIPGPVTARLQAHYLAVLERPLEGLGRKWLEAAPPRAEPPARRRFTVRPASLGDVDAVLRAIVSLRRELGVTVAEELGPPGARQACIALIDGSAKGAILVAEDEAAGHTLCGVLTLSIQHAIRTAGAYADIQELWVHDSYRSQQVGAQLLEAAEQHARKLGLSRLEVGLPNAAFDDHRATYRFYSRHGFEYVGPRLRKPMR
jgi:branched-chain amino acid aminotransferase